MAFSQNPSLTSIQEQIEKLSSDKTLKNQEMSFLRTEILQNLETLMKSNGLTKDTFETALGMARQEVLRIGTSKPAAQRLEKDIINAIAQEEARKRNEELLQAKKEEEERLKNRQLEQLQIDLNKFFDSVSSDSTSAELMVRFNFSQPQNIRQDAAQRIGDFLKQRQNIESFTLSGDMDGYRFQNEANIILSSLPPRLSTLIVKIAGLDNLSMLNNLTKLKIQFRGCTQFPQVPASIEDLDISDTCFGEHTLSRIAALRNLKKINLKGTKEYAEWTDDKWHERPLGKAFKDQLHANNPGIEIVE